MNKAMQYGRSMIEMLGVLAIIGILTVGGFNLVMKVRTHQNINEVTDNITSLAYKVRAVARDYDGLAGLYTDKAYLARAYPDTLEYNASSQALVDRNDVAYTVYYNGNSGEGKSILFMISASGLSTEMCLNMVSANYGTKATSGFVGMSIGDANIMSAVSAIGNKSSDNIAIPGDVSHPMPMSLGTASRFCSENVTMYFAFR